MFEVLNQPPADPILGLTAACRNDRNPEKVDLGVGVYKNEAGQTPILTAVQAAQKLNLEKEASKAYLPPQGTDTYLNLVNELIFGSDHSVIAQDRVATIQGTGGCGSLRVAAELIKRASPNATIWVSDPSWPNHQALLGSSGLALATYPYYHRQQNRLDFEAMVDALSQARAGDLVLIHACCHNPSGADLSREQWHTLTDMALSQGFTPFIDMAYQGFGQGLEDDAYGIRYMAHNLPELVVANSFSKNFGLYRERVGSVSVVVATAAQTGVIRSQLLHIARAIYSMSPSHGAAIVETILDNPSLSQQWRQELDSMRKRVVELRGALVEGIIAAGCDRDFSFIQKQQGMFSFVGLDQKQVETLKSSYSIYMVDSSRINICGLNSRNTGYVAQAIADVLSI